jgi:hypothetical protein
MTCDRHYYCIASLQAAPPHFNSSHQRSPNDHPARKTSSEPCITPHNTSTPRPSVLHFPLLVSALPQTVLPMLCACGSTPLVTRAPRAPQCTVIATGVFLGGRCCRRCLSWASTCKVFIVRDARSFAGRTPFTAARSQNVSSVPCV